jgi:4-alpha-glucanotransferase
MTVESVQTKWGPMDRHSLKVLKDAYAEARRESKRMFVLEGSKWLTDFAKYMIEYCEMEGLTPCDCH